MAFYEYYVDFESKKLTSAYSFPPFGEVVLLSLKSTGEGNEVAMDKFLAICREILDHLPRNPGPYAKKPWTICRECQQILGHLPRLPRTICRECQQILGHLPRLPRTICRECQQILGLICQDCQGLPLKYACQECRVFLGWPWLPAHSAA